MKGILQHGFNVVIHPYGVEGSTLLVVEYQEHIHIVSSYYSGGVGYGVSIVQSSGKSRSNCL